MDRVSRMISAMDGWLPGLGTITPPPEGLFGRVCLIDTDRVHLDAEELDIELVVPFDDDVEANEAEITIYNLSKTTIENIRLNDVITITAGYKDDTGVIFRGYINDIKTVWEGADKKATIFALDDVSPKDSKLESVSYAAGSKASFILKDLVNRLGLPVAVFKTARDWTYEDETTIDGNLMESIVKYADVCGVSAYINKGKVFVRKLTDGDNLNFTVNENTGMIGAPEPFTEDRTAEDYIDTIRGYKVQMLLQHRINTAGIVNLESRDYKGVFRVRKGSHRFNPDEAITEFEVIA